MVSPDFGPAVLTATGRPSRRPAVRGSPFSPPPPAIRPSRTRRPRIPGLAASTAAIVFLPAAPTKEHQWNGGGGLSRRLRSCPAAALYVRIRPSCGGVLRLSPSELRRAARPGRILHGKPCEGEMRKCCRSLSECVFWCCWHFACQKIDSLVRCLYGCFCLKRLEGESFHTLTYSVLILPSWKCVLRGRPRHATREGHGEGERLARTSCHGDESWTCRM